ncbi:MAG: 4-hydroxy-3-methylbut-2-enyl diphosphate reductase [Breznakibacter sp.]
MSIPVVIDPNSGFCFGVKKAVEAAENHLAQGKELFSLGQMVHNGEEVSRLQKKGLTPIEHQGLSSASHKTILFRAHGEPPSSYQKARELNAQIIDATCPVVLKLQQRVKKAWEEMRAINGLVYIYGKKNHPEVTGLLGQTNNEAVLIESADEIALIDFNRPIELFSQTTKNIEGLQHLIARIKERLKPGAYFVAHDTICRQVAGRVPRIRQFAQEHDLIVFVGGTQSSNAKVLFEQCKQVNPNSFFINHIDQISSDWLHIQPKSIGICGATSTPQWQLEQVADSIKNLLKYEIKP